MGNKIKIDSSYQGTITLEVLEGAYKYNKWIYDSIAPYISLPLMEVGAGIGNISELFPDSSKIVLTDNDHGLLEYLKKRFIKKKVRISFFDITKIPSKSEKNKFNSVVAVNVLEHIENDQKALLNLKSVLNKNGKLILLVPAKKIAYNKLDRELGHFRRYEKDDLIKKLNNAGYEIEVIKYFNMLGLATWIIRDYFTHKNNHLTARQIAAFDTVVPFLKRIERVIRPPLGISLIVVAKQK